MIDLLSIKEFKGTNHYLSNMPARYDNLGKNIINLIGNNLKNFDNVSYYNNKKIIITLIKTTLTLLTIIRL